MWQLGLFWAPVIEIPFDMTLRRLGLMALLFVPYIGIAQSFQWAASVGGNGLEYFGGMDTDANGNSYVAGRMNGTLDVDPGPDVHNLTSNGGRDALIYKLDAQGRFVWGFNIGGTGHDYARDVSVSSTGDVVIIGTALGVVDFDPGLGVFNLDNGAIQYGYVLKLDANGNFLWAVQFHDLFVESVKVGPDGDVYIAAGFIDWVDLDPGPGVALFNASFKSTPPTNWSVDAIVCKLDANGNYVDAAHFAGIMPAVFDIYDLEVDDTNNVYLTGSYTDSVDVDPGPDTLYWYDHFGDGFVCRLDSSLDLVWIDNVHSDGLVARGVDLAIDDANQIYVCGAFTDTLTVDSGAMQVLWSGNDYDSWIAKYTPEGNVVWLKSIDAWCEAIVVGNQSNLFLGGIGQNTMDYDPGPGTDSLTAPAGGGAHILQLDLDGNYINSMMMPGPGQTHIYALASTTTAVYAGGFFKGTSDLNPLSGTDLHTATGQDDLFSCKLSDINIPSTKVSVSDCGITLGSFSQYFNCDPVPGAVRYQWRFQNAGLGFDTTAFAPGSNPTSTQMTMVWVNGAQYGTTYDVTVRARVADVWGDYGAVCTITTGNFPTTQLTAGDCGSTLTSINEYVHYDYIQGAERYQIAVADGAGFADTIFSPATNPTATYFSLVFLDGIEYNTSYTVSIRARVAGVWGNFGAGCTVSTPTSVPAPQLTATYCDAALPSINSYFYTTAVPGAQRYGYEVTDGGAYSELLFSPYYAPTATWMTLALAPDIQPSTTYFVRVRAKVGNVWNGYGASCSLTTPASKRNALSSDRALGKARIQIWPNPTTGAFHVFCEGFDDRNVRVRLFNVAGTQVFNSLRFVQNGELMLLLNEDAELTPGVYILQLDGTGHSIVERIVVLNS